MADLTMGFRPCSKNYHALLAALGLVANPVHLAGVAVSSLVELTASAPARAQGAEAVAKVAQAITVRIEGATQGSGVLIKREGNRYTVLTAWHVVSGQRPGEELAIFTPDGKQYQLEQGSIQRLGNVDVGTVTFSSTSNYMLANFGDSKSLKMGASIFVAGYPVATSAVPTRLLRFIDGRVVANSTVTIPNGYQLLYSSGLLPTLPGMSGGPVLNLQGQLVGIHGQSETEDRSTDVAGILVKTGTNQAVPIGYYVQETGRPQTDPRSSSLFERERRTIPPVATRSFTPPADGESRPRRYGVIRFGDTIAEIARRYGLSIAELLRLNPGLETSRLVVDSQVLLTQPAQSLESPLLLDSLEPVQGSRARWPSTPNLQNSLNRETNSSTGSSSTLLAWQVRQGSLEIRCIRGAKLNAFFEEGPPGRGPRVWIDLPGPYGLIRRIPGRGKLREIRIGNANSRVTRLVLEFQPGVSLNPRSLRLVGVSPNRFRMDIPALDIGVSASIGEGSLLP